jgi:hypothetical protein
MTSVGAIRVRTIVPPRTCGYARLETAWGDVAFSSPARAQFDESSSVELVLSPSLPIAELESSPPPA